MAEADNTSTTSTPTTAATETAADEFSKAFERGLPTTIVMSVADWITVSGNPHQRDTDRHLIRAKHLRRPSPAHLQVNAAQLPDGIMIKLDGHTRARLWQLNPELAPENVLVAVYQVASLEQANELYHHFDNKAAVDTATDDLSGAFRAAEFEPTSLLFRSYKGTWAIKTATILMTGRALNSSSINIYSAVPLWLDELVALDQLGATPQRFNHSIIAAALLTIRRRGQSAIDCLDRFQRDAGIKTETTIDGVEGLSRLSMAGLGSGKIAQMTLTGRAIACIEKALNNDVFQVGGVGSGIKGINPARYCAGMRREMKSFVDQLLAAAQKANVEQQRTERAVKRYVLRGPNHLN